MSSNKESKHLAATTGQAHGPSALYKVDSYILYDGDAPHRHMSDPRHDNPRKNQRSFHSKSTKRQSASMVEPRPGAKRYAHVSQSQSSRHKTNHSKPTLHLGVHRNEQEPTQRPQEPPESEQVSLPKVDRYIRFNWKDNPQTSMDTTRQKRVTYVNEKSGQVTETEPEFPVVESSEPPVKRQLAHVQLSLQRHFKPLRPSSRNVYEEVVEEPSDIMQEMKERNLTEKVYRAPPILHREQQMWEQFKALHPLPGQKQDGGGGPKMGLRWRDRETADPPVPHTGVMYPMRYASAPPFSTPGYVGEGVKQPVGVVQSKKVPSMLRKAVISGTEVVIPAWVSPSYTSYGIGGPFGPNGPYFTPPIKKVCADEMNPDSLKPNTWLNWLRKKLPNCPFKDKLMRKVKAKLPQRKQNDKKNEGNKKGSQVETDELEPEEHDEVSGRKKSKGKRKKDKTPKRQRRRSPSGSTDGRRKSTGTSYRGPEKGDNSRDRKRSTKKSSPGSLASDGIKDRRSTKKSSLRSLANDDVESESRSTKKSSPGSLASDGTKDRGSTKKSSPGSLASDGAKDRRSTKKSSPGSLASDGAKDRRSTKKSYLGSLANDDGESESRSTKKSSPGSLASDGTKDRRSTRKSSLGSLANDDGDD